MLGVAGEEREQRKRMEARLKRTRKVAGEFESFVAALLAAVGLTD